MSHRWIAIFYDATGLPRAWGIATDESRVKAMNEAEAIAKRELETYRKEHSDRQEPFKLRVRRFPDSFIT
mgnify:CR=1 FL=1